MRTFIAIEIPESVRAKIFHEFEILKDSGTVIGNFVEKNNLHVTLRFLGELSNEEVEKVSNKLSAIKQDPFEVNISDVGFFPSEEYAKVMWLSVNSPEILDLENKISKSLIEYPLDKEHFSPHLTTVRIKSFKSKKVFFEKVKKMKKIDETFDVKEFVLMKSEKRNDGTVYKVIKKFRLSE